MQTPSTICNYGLSVNDLKLREKLRIVLDRIDMFWIDSSSQELWSIKFLSLCDWQIVVYNISTTEHKAQIATRHYITDCSIRLLESYNSASVVLLFNMLVIHWLFLCSEFLRIDLCLIEMTCFEYITQVKKFGRLNLLSLRDWQIVVYNHFCNWT